MQVWAVGVRCRSRREDRGRAKLVNHIVQILSFVVKELRRAWDTFTKSQQALADLTGVGITKVFSHRDSVVRVDAGDLS